MVKGSDQTNVLEWAMVGAVLYVGLQVVDAITPDPSTDTGPSDAGNPYADQKPTLNPLEVLSICTRVEWALKGAVENEIAAASELIRCNNDADVFAVIHAFGKRRLRPLGTPMDLPAAVTEYLSLDDRAWINDAYRQKGISYMW